MRRGVRRSDECAKALEIAKKVEPNVPEPA
ncbi:hypothetical protein J2S53_001539 [Actinopolyspora lacussalsi]|nr:hypothetical protein [Actinopolyspora lacussalsi]